MSSTPVFGGQAASTGTAWVRVLRWLLALLVGGAVYLWVTSSLIASLVAFWYVFETTLLIVLLFGPWQRESALAFVLPRAVGSALSFVAAFLLLSGWDQVLCLAYVVLLILEALYRAILRASAPALLAGARVALDVARGRASVDTSQDVHLADWRAFLASWSAGLLVVLVVVAGYAYGVRQVLADTRFYASQLRNDALYSELRRIVGETMLRTARSQGPDVRRAVDWLSGDDISTAARMILPQEWTVAVIEQALDVTLEWLQSQGDQRVPPVTLPLGDVVRHAEEAASLLLDQQMADLPLCAPDAPRDAWCRVASNSVVAHIAIYKPDIMVETAKLLEMIPSELDLATVVSMSPRTFQDLLDELDQARLWTGYLDRALSVLGKSIAALAIALFLLTAVAPRTVLRWMGATWLAAGVGTWVLSWGATRVDPGALVRRYAGQTFEGLAGPLADAPRLVLSSLLWSVFRLLAPWALALAALGLLVLVVGLLIPRAATRRAQPEGVVRTLVVCLALVALVWVQYPSLGQQLYGRARDAHREGDVARALPIYRSVVHFFPVVVGDFVLEARRGLRETERYDAATTAYEAGNYETAVRQYEAFLVGNPAIALRESAEANLIAAHYAWAWDLEGQGDYERALDRYRTVRDAFRVPDADQKAADLLLFWGEKLANEGDYRAAVATFGRMAYDVSGARYWREADEQRIETYCAWQASLRAAGQAREADEVCAELLDEYPLAPESCTACSP